MPETTTKAKKDDVAAATIAKLGRLLKEMNITSAFYVDDFNIPVDLPVVTGLLKTILDKGQIEKVQKELNDFVDINLPDHELIVEDFKKKWEQFDEKQQSHIYATLVSFEDNDFNIQDYQRTLLLKSVFPDNSLALISPDEWAQKSKELETTLKKTDKVLLIFDQDLTSAVHDDFKSGRVKGDDLIVQLKKSSIWDQSYCALITHLIESIPDEFAKRKTIAEENKNGLDEKDFFALTKKRNENPELLCDGIKKAILDRYFELIKQKSIGIITEAQKTVVNEITKIDTYDFDQSILISSIEEGIWEVETLLRVANIMYDDSIKRLMKEKNYSEEVNPSIKKAKKISDIKFEIPSDIYPYKDSDEIRRSELYIKEELLNPLNLPLENGDIFEVYSGMGKGLYLLLGQECDLTMRKDGSREAKHAVLCKIDEKPINDVIEDIKNFTIKHGVQNHYLSNKFILEYFSDQPEIVGIISFKKPFYVNLNCLDLVVFNVTGDATTINLDNINTNSLSHSWERRLNKLKTYYEDERKELKIAYDAIKNLRNEAKQRIEERINSQVRLSNNLGIDVPFSNEEFIYGIKRVKRLRAPYSKNILDKYVKYMGRIADLHDFARKG